MNSGQGPAMANRFYVSFNVPNDLQSLLYGYTSGLQYQCDMSELPGRNLTTSDYRTYGPTRKIASLTEYGPITFSIYCSNVFWEKPFFESWAEYINPRNLGWDFRYKDQYATNILITQLGMSDDTPIYQVLLRKAFPFLVSPLPLSWSNEAPHMLSVTFAYDNYEPQITFNNMFDTFLGATNFSSPNQTSGPPGLGGNSSDTSNPNQPILDGGS